MPERLQFEKRRQTTGERELFRKIDLNKRLYIVQIRSFKAEMIIRLGCTYIAVTVPLEKVAPLTLFFLYYYYLFRYCRLQASATEEHEFVFNTHSRRDCEDR